MLMGSRIYHQTPGQRLLTKVSDGVFVALRAYDPHPDPVSIFFDPNPMFTAECGPQSAGT